MARPSDISASLAASSQSLDRLRAQARQSPEQALKAAAQQFEAVFMNMMLKSMREATPQDGAFDSEQTRMFTGMLDQQLAQSMANRGVGLADIMVKQLSRTLPADMIKAQQQAPFVSRAGAANKLSSSYNENVQRDFVQRMSPYANEISRETGVPAPLILGQAALESGWGQHEILLPDGSSSFNLFGIKAGNNWNGGVVEAATTEYSNGASARQVGKFRVYGSYEEAFRDYATLLRDNPRYASVMEKSPSLPDAAYALQRARYATDPNYAGKLVNIMRVINALG